MWESLREYAQKHTDLSLNLSLQSINLNTLDEPSKESANYLVLPSKYYVYLCRCNEVKPSFPTFLVVTKNKYHEKMCRLSNTERSRDNAKQKRIVKLFKKSSQARARIFRWGGGCVLKMKKQTTRGVRGHAPPGKF